MSAAIATEGKAADALRELMNIGSGSALTAFAQLVRGRRLAHSLPVYLPTEAEKLEGQGLDTPGIVAWLEVQGNFRTLLMMCIDHKSVKRIAADMLGRDPTEGELDEMEEGAIRELANIVACAFLDPLSRMLNGALIPSVPYVEMGNMKDLVEEQLAKMPRTVLLSNTFECEPSGYEGKLIVAAAEHTAAQIVQALGVDL